MIYDTGNEFIFIPNHRSSVFLTDNK